LKQARGREFYRQAADAHILCNSLKNEARQSVVMFKAETPTRLSKEIVDNLRRRGGVILCGKPDSHQLMPLLQPFVTGSSTRFKRWFDTTEQFAVEVAVIV